MSLYSARRTTHSLQLLPRRRSADNHGDIVVVATSSITLSPIAVELVCVRAVIGSFAEMIDHRGVSPWL